MTKFCKILKIISIFFVFVLIPVQTHLTSSSDLYSKKVTPVEILSDTTNNLAYRIMYYHSLSNRNNFAFSPTSLISVIIALYEGSYGRGNSELQNYLGLPNNKDTSRIGLRDIHRRLRTYSFPQDNPLIGLCLNKENVTITPQYEAILKFYGYDLDFNVTDIQTFISEVFTIVSNDTAIEMKEITENSTLKSIPVNISENQTDIITTLKPFPNNSDAEIISTTIRTIVTTKIPEEMTTTITEIITTEGPELAAYIRSKDNQNFGKIRKITDYWPTSINVSTQNFQIFPAKTNNKEKRIKLSIRNKKIPNNQQNRSTRNKRFLMNGFTTLLQTPYTLGNSKYFDPPTITNSHLIIDDGTTLGNIGNPEILSQPIHSFFNPIVEPFHIGNFGIDLDSRYLFPKEASLKSTINHIFYLNNHETIQINYKTYNSVLNYKYLAAQKMTILELELNSDNYNLIIFLPDFNIDIDTAVASLKYIPSLRNLKKQMKPKWVQAIIPDLKLRGKVYLTNDLQNMGVRDIFEPSRADFSLMTNENDIYVKHIEQIIDVNIRTRPINQVKGNIAQQFQPIEVAVNHPFLFFIVDKEVYVAILAGRALNPLNLRIQ